jgi:hypothetical protein
MLSQLVQFAGGSASAPSEKAMLSATDGLSRLPDDVLNDISISRDEIMCASRNRRQPHRLVFIYETSVNTKMTRLRGPRRLRPKAQSQAPFGKWGTQTFIAGLRCDRLTAPWIIDRPVNRAAFDTYIETQLAPTLKRGDIVILDNLAVHKSARAAECLKKVGAWFLFLPAYSPDHTRSRWPSPNSRRISEPPMRGPSIPS